MAAALEVINSDQSVKAILINIFGGITRGEEVANGIVEALGRVELRAPIVIRLDGTNAEEGRRILDAGILSDKLHQPAHHARRRPHRRRPREREEGNAMAIFVDENTKVIVQGLTGGQGRFHGLRNKAYGTQVVAGVTPGKGGQDVEGIPIFDTVADAVAATGATASFVVGAAQGAPPPPSWRPPRPACRSWCASPRASRPRTRPGLQHPEARLPRHPAARPELPRDHHARASATSGSPPARSPCRRSPASPPWAS